MGSKIVIEPEQKNSFATEIVAEITGVDEEEIMNKLENGEKYIVEDVSSHQQAKLATPFLLIEVSDMWESLSKEEREELKNEHNMSEKDIKIIEEFPNVDISEEKYNNIVDEISEGMFGG